MKNQKDLYWLCGDFWEVIRQSLKTDNIHDTGILQQTAAVIWWLALSFKLYCIFMHFLIFSSFLMHIFPVPKEKNLIVVFFTLVPLHAHCLFSSLSLFCISLSFITSLDEEKEQSRAKCWRTEWSGERLEFIKNKWLLDNDLFNHKWALWAWSSEARREERAR